MYLISLTYVVYLTEEGTKLGGVNLTEFSWEEEDSFGFPDEIAEKLGPWYPMTQERPVQALPFHEDCWILLNQQFQEKINLDRLFEVCKNIPPSGRFPYGELTFKNPFFCAVRIQSLT